jgi:hypothetical protein
MNQNIFRIGYFKLGLTPLEHLLQLWQHKYYHNHTYEKYYMGSQEKSTTEVFNFLEYEILE